MSSDVHPAHKLGHEGEEAARTGVSPVVAGLVSLCTLLGGGAVGSASTLASLGAKMEAQTEEIRTLRSKVDRLSEQATTRAEQAAAIADARAQAAATLSEIRAAVVSASESERAAREALSSRLDKIDDRLRQVERTPR